MISHIALIIFISSAVYFLLNDTALDLLIIPLIAGISYAFMIRDKKNTKKYRFTDWAITTPIMLYGLLKANNTPLTPTLVLILLDLLMVGSTALGEKTDSNHWFLIGGACFLPIAYALYHLKATKPAAYLTLLVWSIYPFIWILHKDNMIKLDHANISFTVLDIISKVGMLDLLM